MHARRALMCISLAEDAQAEEHARVARADGDHERLEGFFAEQIRLGQIHGDAHRLAAYFMGMCFSYVIARKIWDSYSIKEADLDCMVDIFLNGVKSGIPY